MNLKMNMFRNKKGQERHPDYRGNGTDADTGAAYEVAGWVRQDKHGNDYIYIQIQVPRERTGFQGQQEQQAQPQHTESQKAPQGFADTNDLPF